MYSKNELEICHAVVDSTYGYQHGENGVLLHLTDGEMHVRRICDIVVLTKKLVMAPQIEFHVSTNKRNGYSFIHSSPLGMKVAELLQHSVHHFRRYFPMHQFNPYFDLLEKHGSMRQLFVYRFLAPHDRDSAIKVVDFLNGFVTDIRKEGRSAKFVNFKDNYIRTTNKSYQGLTGYIDQIFENHVDQFVVRMDFCYKNPNNYLTAEDNAKEYEDLIRHRKALQEFLESKVIFGEDVFLGSAWKVEYGPYKYFNLHALMFFNANTLPESLDLSKIIGNHWTNEVTQGEGLYFNCQAYPSNFKKCGTGLIRSHDITGQTALKKAAIYMTKTAYFIKLLAPANKRTFGRKSRERIKKIEPHTNQCNTTPRGVMY